MNESRTYTMPQAFMNDKSVPTHWRLLGYLNGFFMNGNEVWASNSTIGAELGVSDRSIITAVSKLQELHIIFVKRTKTSRILLPAIGVKPVSGGGETNFRGGGNELHPNSDSLIQKDNTDISTNVDKEQALVVQEEYGKREINDILSFLKKLIGIDDFKEPSAKQRQFANHIVNLANKIGKQELIDRLKVILVDGFKRKNCNSIMYLYRELKSFIHEENSLVATEKKVLNKIGVL